MKAIVATKPGGPEVLEVQDVPVPDPGPGEVRLRLEAAALNHLDLWVREGVPGATHPRILGCEGAGTVDALGDGVVGIEPGEEVLTAPGVGCGSCRSCGAGRESFCRDYRMIGYQRDGTYAEFVVLPAECAIRKPPRFTWQEAAAFPLTALTAWHMLFERGRLQPGELVLVMAGGSGVGQAAIQIARAAGARVLATAGSQEKRDRAARLGAEETVDYTVDGWHRQVRTLTRGEGVDLIVDHTGHQMFPSAMKCLSTGGRIVLCGATSGSLAQLDLRFLFARQQEVIGSYMGSRGELLEALRLAELGKLTPVIDRVVPLESARAGHETMRDRAQFGKIVLQIGDS